MVYSPIPNIKLVVKCLTGNMHRWPPIWVHWRTPPRARASVYSLVLRSILQCPSAMSLFPPQMLLLPFPDAALGTAAMLIPLHRFCPYAPPRLYCPASLSLLPPLMRVPVLVRLDHLNATLVRPVRRLKQRGSGPVRRPNRPLRKGLPPPVRRPPGLDAAASAGQPPQAPGPSRAPVADASVNLVLGPPPDAEGPRPPWFGRRSPESSAGRSTTGTVGTLRLRPAVQRPTSTTRRDRPASPLPRASDTTPCQSERRPPRRHGHSLAVP